MSHESEKTTWSPGLIGFYASCTAVALGAAIAAVGLLVFGGMSLSSTVVVVGIVMLVGGAISALHFLKAARKELR